MSADPIPALIRANPCSSCGAGMGQACKPPAGIAHLIPAAEIPEIMASGWICAARYQLAIATRN